MKKYISLVNIFVLCLSLVMLTGCPRPRSTTVTVTRTCIPGQPCRTTVSVTVVYLVGGNNVNAQALANEVSEYVGILDLSNAFRPDATQTLQATVKIRDENGQLVEQSFPVTLSQNLSATIDPVDKETTPYAYKFTSPSDVTAFLNANSVMLSDSDTEVSIESGLPIVQENCGTPTGKYINHLRVMDDTGITYVDGFYLVFTAINGCTEFEVSVDQ